MHNHGWDWKFGKWIEQAQHAQAMGDADGARRLCGKILRQNPAHPEANHLFGLLLAARQDYDTALTHLERAAALAPASAEIQNNLGNVYRARANLDRAEQCYRRALTLAPGMAQAHANLGVICKLRGRLDEAADHYRRALHLNPAMAGAHYTLGVVLKEQGKLTEAVEHFRRALALDPGAAEVHASLGQALRKQNRIEEAVEHFRRAIALNPRLAAVHEALGQIHKEQGKLDEAMACFRRAVECGPGNHAAQYQLAALAGESIAAAPRSYVSNLFDQYADTFDLHLAEKLEYRAPQQLRSLLDECGSGQRFRQAVDLGCGTGLCGEKFRDVVDRLAGIDLSAKMIQKAGEKKLYDALRLGDIVEILDKENELYDLILAVDTFIYLGDLEPVFRSVARRADAGALFMFSTETCEAETYVLRRTCRYAHSRQYIQSLAGKYGFSMLACQTAPLRRDVGEWVPGDYYAIRHSTLGDISPKDFEEKAELA